jgi:hypothetical protein
MSDDPRVTLHLAEYEVVALRRALTRALAEHQPIFSQRLTYNRILDVIGRCCCERDTDNDGNCHIHSAPGVLRVEKR